MIVVYDDAYAEHLRGVAHPESPDRVTGVMEHLRANGLLGGQVGAADASDVQLQRVHPRRYVERVERDVAELEAGRVAYLSTGDTVIDHGSVAVAARTFVAERGGRVLIVDFDYHHGNGTQAASGRGVSFVSTHAFPQYPGTGSFAENLLDPEGAVVNVPLPPDFYGTEAFVATWQRLLPAVAARVRPDAIVVSAGYDFAAGDPVGDLGVDGPLAARALAVLIRDVAGQYAHGRVAYCLEGGYDVETLGRCVAATLRANDDVAPSQDLADHGAIPPAQRAMIDEVVAWRS